MSAESHKAKSVLFSCNTYYQLLLAIQMKKTLMKEDAVDIIVSHHSKNIETVVRRLETLPLFRKVYYAEKDFPDVKQSKWKKLQRLLCVLGAKKSLYLPDLSGKYYDEFVYYNLNISALEIFASLYKTNRNVEVSRYEEGLASCMMVDFQEGAFRAKHFKLAFFLRSLLGRQNITDQLCNFYCYYPELYTGKATPVRVPLVESDAVKEDVATLFDLHDLQYPQKYIYFASVGDFEGGAPVGEVDTALKIAELVGRDNLLVKVHPRDKSGKFEASGLALDKNSSAPWEAIQFNYDFGDHVFLTISSGSVFGANVMLKRKANVFFLYQTVDVSNNYQVKESVDSIKNIMKHTAVVGQNIYSVVDDLREITE